MQIPDDAKQCILLAVREDGLQYDATYELVRLTEEYIHSFIGDDVQVPLLFYNLKHHQLILLYRSYTFHQVFLFLIFL